MTTPEEARPLTALEELQQIQEYLDGLEIPTKLLQRSEDLDVDALLVGLPADAGGWSPEVSFLHVPVGEGQLQHVRLLQLAVPYPVELEPLRRPAVCALLTEINPQLPLGQLAINPAEQIQFRHVHVYPAGEAPPREVVLELLQLFAYSASLFRERIAEIASPQG